MITQQTDVILAYHSGSAQDTDFDFGAHLEISSLNILIFVSLNQNNEKAQDFPLPGLSVLYSSIR
jgi:hypothetical protein